MRKDGGEMVNVADINLANVLLREETGNDLDAIHQVHELAFGGDGEARLVDDLRQNDFAAISIVAEQQGKIVGHILLSRLAAPMRALALAPVGVHPSFQRQGIGSALIRKGLMRAQEDCWTSIFVLGDPAYYKRFGFNTDGARSYTSPYSGDHFMILSFGPEPIPANGEIVYPFPFSLLDE